ncbi:YkoF family thiamine/hydroxymethylpyrimidine-binding protein [Desulfolucanica intricata]|uniref:YkoF family thiamine/hydroxymethylpyrimidine-binding protein n=1 Tax=Desulfolucanica intricata TaxID=1285191 RepID=UPI00082AE848|nr:YkoF family thiamine/hydroxymethylpyrimidine-binding protein [Desulfolucanica intricata]
MLSAEVSLYPQKTSNASQIINNSIESLKQYNLQFNVGPISTKLQGSEEEIWAGLKSLFDQAKNQSEVNMVVTLSNSAN